MAIRERCDYIRAQTLLYELQNLVRKLAISQRKGLGKFVNIFPITTCCITFGFGSDMDFLVSSRPVLVDKDHCSNEGLVDSEPSQFDDLITW